MAREGHDPVVVRPPIKTLEHWVYVLVVFVVMVLPWFEVLFTGEFSGRFGCLLGLTGFWLVLLVMRMIAGGLGAIADDRGLTLENVWWLSASRHFAWSDILAVEKEAHQGRRRILHIARLQVREVDEQRWIKLRCPYSEALVQEIVSRGRLNLVKAPEERSTDVPAEPGIRAPLVSRGGSHSSHQRHVPLQLTGNLGSPMFSSTSLFARTDEQYPGDKGNTVSRAKPNVQRWLWTRS